MANSKRVVHTALLLLMGCWFSYELYSVAFAKISSLRFQADLVKSPLPTERGADWPALDIATDTSKARVFLALSPNCQPCVDSVPFYRMLLAKARMPESHFSVTVLMKRGVDNEAFLSKLSVPQSDVYEVNLGKAGVESTPTLWVVSNQRKVLEIRNGMISPVDQGYLAAVANGSLPSDDRPVENVIPLHLSSAGVDYIKAGKTKVQIIDIRQRRQFQMNHRPDAINIPSDELYVRARAELNRSNLTILDCTLSDARVCDGAAYNLGTVGFSKVSLLNHGASSVAAKSVEVQASSVGAKGQASQ